MKRNIRISDNFGRDFVIIETDKSPGAIEEYCRLYCYQIDNRCYTLTPDAIGELLFDTEISVGEPPAAVEDYYLEDYWED